MCDFFNTYISTSIKFENILNSKAVNTQENGTGKFAAGRETQRHAQGV